MVFKQTNRTMRGPFCPVDIQHNFNASTESFCIFFILNLSSKIFMEFIEIFFFSLRLAIQDLKEDRKTFQASLKASPKFDSELLRFIGMHC
jgi:hypothetical protein